MPTKQNHDVLIVFVRLHKPLKYLWLSETVHDATGMSQSRTV